MNQVLKCKEIPKTWFKNLQFFHAQITNVPSIFSLAGYYKFNNPMGSLNL